MRDELTDWYPRSYDSEPEFWDEVCSVSVNDANSRWSRYEAADRGGGAIEIIKVLLRALEMEGA